MTTVTRRKKVSEQYKLREFKRQALRDYDSSSKPNVDLCQVKTRWFLAGIFDDELSRGDSAICVMKRFKKARRVNR